MKSNTILLVVLAALIGTAVFVRQGNKKTFSGGGTAASRELLLPGLPLDGTIRKIEIRDGGKSITITGSKDRWTVAERNDYPAAADKIRRVLNTLSELKTIRGKTLSKESLGSVKLLAPDEGPADRAGMLVNFMNDKGDSVAKFIVGNPIESTGGASSANFMGGPSEPRYVRLPKEENAVWVVADNFSTELKPEPADWVDKSFIDVRKLKDITITATNPEDSWGAQRKDENSEFTLLGAKDPTDSLDTAKASGLSYLLANPTFTDVQPAAKAAPDFMKGAITAKINTFEDFTYDVKLVEKKSDKGEADAKTWLSFTVSANIPKERKPEKDEKEEDKKKKDEEFASRKKELEAKLAKEKAMEGWIYDVASYAVSTLTKKRSEVLREKPKPPATPEIKLPQPPAGTPPAPAPAPAPATATTPPVSIPEPPKPEPAKPEPAKSTTPKSATTKPAPKKP